MGNHNIHNILFCFHLCILIGALLPIPFGNILLPWFYWLYKGGRKNREISGQACRALNFQFLCGCLVFVYAIIAWTSFINMMASGNKPDYVWLAPIVCFYTAASVLYPFFILVYMNITRKSRQFYPKTIYLFK